MKDVAVRANETAIAALAATYVVIYAVGPEDAQGEQNYDAYRIANFADALW